MQALPRPPHRADITRRMERLTGRMFECPSARGGGGASTSTGRKPAGEGEIVPTGFKVFYFE